MFQFLSNNLFKKNYKNLVKNNKKLKAKIDLTLIKLANNPQDPTLGSHKVNLSLYGEVWSSKVNGDTRIIWDYNNSGEIEIILINIGGHNQVYR
jgi:mRNA-degrading endonuclease YafQ of YafQ-DinJ toxin-antitoxin module